jgi:hypothetical protein
LFASLVISVAVLNDLSFDMIMSMIFIILFKQVYRIGLLIIMLGYGGIIAGFVSGEDPVIMKMINRCLSVGPDRCGIFDRG